MRSWKADKENFKEYMIESFQGSEIEISNISDDDFQWFWYHLDRIGNDHIEKGMMDKLSKSEFAKFCRGKKINEIINV